MTPALNFSTDVDLFSAISSWVRRFERIPMMHPPHSTWDGLMPRSAGHLAQDLPTTT